MLRLFRKSTPREASTEINPPLLTADWNTKFHEVLDSKRVRVSYWPAYKNPYQALFYGASSNRFSAVPADIDMALQRLNATPEEAHYFHLHWLNFLGSGPEIMERTSAFLKKLQRYKELGGQILWTVHNFREHDQLLGEREPQLRAAIAEVASAIIVHSMSARKMVAADLGISEARITVLPHGSYIGVYPDTISSAEARSRLNIAPATSLFVSLGLLRPYKGHDALCASVESLSNAQLVLAGKILKRDQPALSDFFGKFSKTEVF